MSFHRKEEILHAFAGHDWDGCVCRVCSQLRHDFRNTEGQSPQDTECAGTFRCTRCTRVFYRTIDPPEGCENCYECEGTGQIERYSSQSGQVGSWFETSESSSRLKNRVKEWIEEAGE